MARRSVWFLCVAAVLGLAGTIAVQAAEPPIKIGAIFAITGPASFLGEPERNTAVMIADEVNKIGRAHV